MSNYYKRRDYRVTNNLCLGCGKEKEVVTVLCGSCLERHRKHRKRKELENRKRFMLYRAKGNAKNRGIPFDLQEEDFEIPEFCPVLGIRLKFNANQSQDNSPSLDRIDNEIGYVKGNVVVISLRANRAKNNLSLEELKRLVSWLEFIREEL